MVQDRLGDVYCFVRRVGGDAGELVQGERQPRIGVARVSKVAHYLLETAHASYALGVARPLRSEVRMAGLKLECVQRLAQCVALEDLGLGRRAVY